MNILKQAIAFTAVVFARLGLIDEARGRRIADIAWPRVVTGLARTSQRTADFIMVGIAIGPAAIAGMGFAFAYWSIARGIGFSLANGGMAFLSQRYGSNDTAGFDLAYKQTLFLELILAGITAALFIGIPYTLIGILGAGPDALRYGATYIQVVALGLGFVVINHISSVALISGNDAWTPMVLRAGGATLNIGLNAIFIFGLGLGVTGAALGTVISELLVSLIFIPGLLRQHLPHFGNLPVSVTLTPPYFDLHLTTQIITVSTPLVGRRIVSRASQFLMLAIVAQFGTIVVAGYVASREVREIMNTPSWGFGTAGRSLVGQALGADEEGEATEIGWDILRFTGGIYILMSIIMLVFAGPIAAAFTDDPSAINSTIPFVQVMGLSLLGLGIDEAASGVLTAGGDTSWPLYGRLVGLYVFMIPIAYLGTITPIGILALYIAITAETVVPAVITFFRFNTAKWIDISRQYRTPSND